MAKKKHQTPPKLDYLFERHVITKAAYEDFWTDYWKEKRQRDKDRYTDQFVANLQLELPFKKRMTSGTITFSIRAAEEQARNIGGYVIRVTKSGRPSKRGKYYRAIRKKNTKAKPESRKEN